VDYRTPYLSVSLDGAGLSGVREVRVSRAVGGDNGVATITLDVSEGYGIGGSVAVVAGFDGGGQPIFVGFVARAEGAIPRGGALEARDRLERMKFPWGGTPRIYRSQGTADYDDANIIRNLLEAYAIDSQFASIESSAIGTLGVVEPVRLNTGDVPWNLIREMDQNAGYATFTRGNGSVYRRPLETGGGGAHYIEGVNIISGRRTVTRDGIENRAVVTGLTYEGTAVGGTATRGNGDVPDPPGFIARDLTSNLIETDAQALIAAAAHIASHGATPDEVELTVIGDNAVDLGDSISVTSPSLGLAGNSFFVIAVTHTIGTSGYTTTLRGRTFA
jgi:hypothetical protein